MAIDLKNDARRLRLLKPGAKRQSAAKNRFDNNSVTPSDVDNITEKVYEDLNVITEGVEAIEASLGGEVTAATQGYFSVETGYNHGGVATDTVIASGQEDTWLDVAFSTDANGLSDERPLSMVQANTSAFDDSTGIFKLEGLASESFAIFKASFSFDPDEDNGEVSIRLVFNHHSGVTPTTSTAQTIAGTFSQGADDVYVVEPLLTFNISEDIDTNGVGDAGTCKLQINSTVPGTVSVRGLTWYLYK